MKLLDGQTLSSELATRTSLATRLALLPNLLAVADALGYAHAQGYVLPRCSALRWFGCDASQTDDLGIRVAAHATLFFTLPAQRQARGRVSTKRAPPPGSAR
jgi:hypothetical protein